MAHALLLLILCLCAGPAGAAPPDPVVTLAAVGDILLDRGVARRIEEHGAGYPFEKVAGILSAADLAAGNLECPLADGGVPVLKPYSFRARPDATECLRRAGLDLVSLANNHTLDCGREGLTETMGHLARAGIRWFGAGQTLAEAEAPALLTVKGLRIAFVGFCDFLPEGTFLRDDRPGIALANDDAVRRAVAAARARADVVVASFHWGVERVTYRTDRQVALARIAVDAGASLVLGHHPHVLQRTEYLAPGRLAAYSLGNFVFDAQRGLSAESAILRCRLGRRGVLSADAVPVVLQAGRPVPVPAGGETGKRILRRLGLP